MKAIILFLMFAVTLQSVDARNFKIGFLDQVKSHTGSTPVARNISADEMADLIFHGIQPKDIKHYNKPLWLMYFPQINELLRDQFMTSLQAQLGGRAMTYEEAELFLRDSMYSVPIPDVWTSTGVLIDTAARTATLSDFITRAYYVTKDDLKREHGFAVTPGGDPIVSRVCVNLTPIVFKKAITPVKAKVPPVIITHYTTTKTTTNSAKKNSSDCCNTATWQDYMSGTGQTNFNSSNSWTQQTQQTQFQSFGTTTPSVTIASSGDQMVPSGTVVK